MAPAPCDGTPAAPVTAAVDACCTRAAAVIAAASAAATSTASTSESVIRDQAGGEQTDCCQNSESRAKHCRPPIFSPMVWWQRTVLAVTTPSDEDLIFEVRVFSAETRSSAQPRAASGKITDRRCLCAAARRPSVEQHIRSPSIGWPRNFFARFPALCTKRRPDTVGPVRERHGLTPVVAQQMSAIGAASCRSTV